jgi:hypothetical protein
VPGKQHATQSGKANHAADHRRQTACFFQERPSERNREKHLELHDKGRHPGRQTQKKRKRREQVLTNARKCSVKHQRLEGRGRPAEKRHEQGDCPEPQSCQKEGVEKLERNPNRNEIARPQAGRQDRARKPARIGVAPQHGRFILELSSA